MNSRGWYFSTGEIVDLAPAFLKTAKHVYTTSTREEKAGALHRWLQALEAVRDMVDDVGPENSPEEVLQALEIGIPAASEQPEFAQYGGLLSYGPSIFAIAKRQAYYVDRILKGAKVADLPAEYPSKLELVVNAKIAKALGLTLPLSLLAQADEVIE